MGDRTLAHASQEPEGHEEPQVGGDGREQGPGEEEEADPHQDALAPVAVGGPAGDHGPDNGADERSGHHEAVPGLGDAEVRDNASLGSGDDRGVKTEDESSDCCDNG